MGLNAGFWHNRSVLVTGHTGFKGSWLCLWLKSLGAKVTGYPLSPQTKPNLFKTTHTASGMDSRIGDVRDPTTQQTTIDEAAVEIVFHLAAQPLVRERYSDPIGTWNTNVTGTLNLLESLRNRCGQPVVVVITSDKCYENREWLWPYRETEALGGHDPYSSSKAD